jgi:adenylate cyclase
VTKLDVYKKEVDVFFDGDYEIVKTKAIPEVSNLKFGKHAKEVELAILFIDIRESTKIMASMKRSTGAKIYKSFLWGISKIAKDNSGEVRSFNGDGVLVVFVGNYKCNSAVRAAMQMKYFCQTVLKPKADVYLKNKESLEGTLFDYGIGIDHGTVLVVRGGMRGDNNNDLVWVSNATNYAVKMSGISSDPYNIRISDKVYALLDDSRKKSGDESMWEKMLWNEKNLYRTKFKWPISN